MEIMLRLFLPPIISSTSQYGGASWVWLIVMGIIVFFLEAFFAFTIGGLLVTWWNVIGLPPIVM
jgi:membrane-bound ClpP family serine protease